MTTKFHPLRKFSDDQALTWIRSQPEARISLSQAQLAQCWGWSRQTVSKRLRLWEMAQLINRDRLLISIADQATGVKATRPAAAFGTSSAIPAVRERLGVTGTSSGEGNHFSPATSRTVAVVLATVAAALASLGTILNARYAATFGRSADSAAILAGLGMITDLLATTSPTAATQLWAAKHRMSALALWAIWLGATCMMLLASSGFAARELGDALADRARIIDQGHGYSDRLHRLRAEREDIDERRSAVSLDVELQRVRGTVGAAWSRSKGCTDIKRPEAIQACDSILRLRQARGEAARRDAIDVEISDLEQKLADAPAIGSADPGPEFAVDAIDWITASRVRLSQQDVLRVRIVGFAVLPSMNGLILGFALTLWRAPVSHL